MAWFHTVLNRIYDVIAPQKPLQVSLCRVAINKGAMFSLALAAIITSLAILPIEAADLTFYQSGVQAYRKGDMTQVLQYMREAYKADPGNPNVRYYMAIALDRMDRANEAQTQYQFVVKNGNDPDVVQYAKYRLRQLNTPQLLSVQTLSGASIVPLKNVRNALMVEATLYNSKTGRSAKGTFIIDTGATYTSISEELAAELGLDLDTGESVRITTANGRIDVPKVHLDTVNVNGVEANDIQATVIHVRENSSFAGLLGLSFIRQFKMTIDPTAGQLVFEPTG